MELGSTGKPHAALLPSIKSKLLACVILQAWLAGCFLEDVIADEPAGWITS